MHFYYEINIKCILMNAYLKNILNSIILFSIKYICQ